MTDPNPRVLREARLQWVPMPKMKVSPLAQRELNQSRVDKLVADLDLERIGTPTVNGRDEHFFIIDGHHRVEALRQFGLGDSSIQCWTYHGLTEKQEAEAFLKLNDTLTVTLFDRFRTALTAGRETECEINRVVMANGLNVTRQKQPGGVGAVGTLMRVHSRAGSPTLGKTLRVIRDAFGDAGLEAPLIDGIGLICQRYNGEISEADIVKKLGALNGGAGGLLGKAGIERRTLGCPLNHAVASATVKVLNAGKGGKKLPDWWSK